MLVTREGQIFQLNIPKCLYSEWINSDKIRIYNTSIQENGIYLNEFQFDSSIVNDVLKYKVNNDEILL